jgi:iron-sulfur cluster repair protein YtfE (RIC family)
MKRHPALQELSRDHHHALVVAQRLKRAQATSKERTLADFRQYWEADGSAHFRQEEDILLPTLARFTDPSHPVVACVLIDHVRIRALVDELGEDPQLSTLRSLGRELEQHVRHEERQLFPLIEQAMPEAQLVQLVSRLAT